MLIDAQHLFSDAQALTATGASTNSIDLGSDRDIGPGEPMAVVLKFDAALAGTSPTISVAIQTDDNSSFSSPTTIITSQTLSSAAAGTQVVVPLPAANERYVRLNYTLNGTTPTATVTSFLTRHEMVDTASSVSYPNGYTV